MIPIVDMHIHLLAGLDDGPKTLQEAEQMARILVQEGVTHTVALAHQNSRYPQNSAATLREATSVFVQHLEQNGIPLSVFPCGEVCLGTDLVQQLDQQFLLSVADNQQYLLLEFPNDQAVDLTHWIAQLRQRKIRLILAHAERVEAWRESPAILEEWIRQGCLVQVTSSAFQHPRYEKPLRQWTKQKMIHLLGSDGHSVERRPPTNRAGVSVLEKWIGIEAASKIASVNALAVLRGNPVVIEPPEMRRKSWFSRLFGN